MRMFNAPCVPQVLAGVSQVVLVYLEGDEEFLEEGPTYVEYTLSSDEVALVQVRGRGWWTASWPPWWFPSLLGERDRHTRITAMLRNHSWPAYECDGVRYRPPTPEELAWITLRIGLA